jgi:hypothetical protein
VSTRFEVSRNTANRVTRTIQPLRVQRDSERASDTWSLAGVQVS